MPSDIFESFARERDLLIKEYGKAQASGDNQTAAIVLDELYNSCFNYYVGLGGVISNLERLKKSHPAETKDIENKIYSVARQRSDLANKMREWTFETADMEFVG